MVKTQFFKCSIWWYAK